MKTIIFVLLFLPLSICAQSFKYDRIVTDLRDTVKSEGVIVDKRYPDSVHEFTIYPGTTFAFDEFRCISFLDYRDRVFVKTTGLTYFKDFLDPLSVYMQTDKFVVIARNKTFHFLRSTNIK